MAAQQRFRITVAVVVVCSLLPLAYSVFHQSAHRQAQPTTGTVRSADAGNRRPGTAMVLQVTPAPYQLPAAMSREVVLPGAGGLLVAGGLTPFGSLGEHGDHAGSSHRRDPPDRPPGPGDP